MTEIEFAREGGWSPRVLRQNGHLRLEVVGGADALHDPRTFSFRIGEAHLAILRDDLARHLALWSALLPLCDAAGTDGPLDEDAAVALLDPILLGPARRVDAFLRGVDWDRDLLVAHGAAIGLLDRGEVLAAMSDASEKSDWRRAEEDQACRDRARRGVTLSGLDVAVLQFTGQYLHAATIPRRDAAAVAPADLSAVLRVIETAERSCAGLTIARDPRRGPTGTDKRDWQRMERTVQAALRAAYPALADDAVGSVAFLMCSEAADRARKEPYDVEGSPAEARDPSSERTLTFSDDQDVEQVWNPGDAPAPVEAFWQFVADRSGPDNEVFTLEDEVGEGVQLHFYADSIARILTLSDGDDDPVYQVEYGLVDGLAHYRRLVREYVAGGFAALDGLSRWTSDNAEFEEWRRQRAED